MSLNRRSVRYRRKLPSPAHSLPPPPPPPPPPPVSLSRALFFFSSILFRYRNQPLIFLRHPLRGRLPATVLKCHVAEARCERVLTYDGRRDSSKSVR